MDDDFAEIEAATKRSLRLGFDDMLRARREAEQTPPPPLSLIPQPDLLPGGIARFRCPLGCGWWHDENPGLESSRLILPVGFTRQDLSDALSLNAEASGLALRDRVERAIVQHYRERHPSA
ncbi:hypothetical protein [Streptomyces malaysiensis]